MEENLKLNIKHKTQYIYIITKPVFGDQTPILGDIILFQGGE